MSKYNIAVHADMVYYTDVEAKSEEEAVAKAEEEFSKRPNSDLQLADTRVVVVSVIFDDGKKVWM